MWYLNLWILNRSSWCRWTDWTIALWFVSHDEGLRTRWSHFLFMRCWFRILNITTFPDLWLWEELFAFWSRYCLCRCRLFKKRLRRCCAGSPRFWGSRLSRRWFITRAFPYKLNFTRRAIALSIVLRLNTAVWTLCWWWKILKTEFLAAL